MENDKMEIELPDEVVLNIFKRLRGPELTSASLANKNYWRISNDDRLWIPLYSADYEKDYKKRLAENGDETNKHRYWRKQYNRQKRIDRQKKLIEDSGMVFNVNHATREARLRYFDRVKEDEQNKAAKNPNSNNEKKDSGNFDVVTRKDGKEAKIEKKYDPGKIAPIKREGSVHRFDWKNFNPNNNKKKKDDKKGSDEDEDSSSDDEQDDTKLELAYSSTSRDYPAPQKIRRY
jgi:hypothetical protein